MRVRSGYISRAETGVYSKALIDAIRKRSIKLEQYRSGLISHHDLAVT